MKTMIALAVAGAALLSAEASAQDYNGPPDFGETNLSAGFTPDPHTVSLQAGGNIDARAAASYCGGYIGNNPDYRITYTAGSLPLIISAISSADTTLVISAPDGRWYCDDDSGAGYANPQFTFSAPLSGRYEIWVGSFRQGETPSATLRISEMN